MAFFGLTIAVRGLTAQQQALDVIGHNVANANTEGYTRQEAVQQATVDTAWGLNKVGSGVVVENVRRIRDALLDKQVRSQLAAQGNWDTTRSYLEEVESVFNEPSDEGFAAQFEKVWGAWQDLSASPESYAARGALIQSAGVLTDLLQRDYQQLSSIRDRADSDVDAKVSESSGWLADIAALNQQISNEKGVGMDPNELSDRRDLLLDKVSKALKVYYHEETDGSVTVKLNDSSGELLVDHATAYSLRRNGSMGSVQRDDGTGTWADITPLDGELKAMLDARDVTLNPASSGSLANRLDELAAGIIDLVNGHHQAGFGQDGATTGLDFFSGTGAANIAVSSTLVSDPKKIAAASVAGLSGTGDNALLIAQKLKSQLAVPSSSATATVADWYQTFISKVGVDTAQAKSMSDNQGLLVDHLKMSRESYSGVSLDDEAVNLIRYQRAYQASANVIQAIDAMLDKLVNGVGLVGR